MRITMLRTIEEPDGDRVAVYPKGAIINVSKEMLGRFTAAGDEGPAAEDYPDEVKGKVSCLPRIVSLGDTDVRVTANASPANAELPNGVTEVAQVRLVETRGGAKVLEAPAPKFAKAGEEWVLNRPEGENPGQAVFHAQLTGYEQSDNVTLLIPPRERESNTEEA